MSANSQNMSNCSKTADEQIPSVCGHCVSPVTANQKTGLVEIGQGNGSLPKPYSPEWQGWATEGKNFKRCGKCQTRQRNGRGFTCWVRGCGYVFVKTIQNKKPYYCKKNPAPKNHKQLRKELRKKNNQKRKRAPKTSQKESTSKKARVASDSPLICGEDNLFMVTDSGDLMIDPEMVFDPEMFNLDSSDTPGVENAPESSDGQPSPPVLTRGDSLTPTGEIESGTPFNYDNIPLDLSLFENNTESTDEEDADLFERFFS